MAGKGMKKTNLKFVIPEGCQSEDEASDSMKMAFQECSEADLAPVWITEAEVSGIRFAKNTVVVLQDFSGPTFDKLRTTKCVVCGPMCLRSCLTGNKQIPENKSPVFTTAMRDIIVTASQVPSTTKAALKERVGFMGGVYVNNLTESVTHLLTNSVQSAKYEQAGETGIPVMRTEWVDAAWQVSQERNIHATEPELMSKYRCPVFYNLYVTTSNLIKAEKEEVRRLISDNGGTFTTQMKQNETMLLIVNEPRGDKYKHARLWNVPCVRTAYLKDSLVAGYALPTSKYLLEPTMRCSTPTKEDDMANFTCNSEAGMISVINFDSSKTHIDDTQATFCSVASSQTSKPNRPSGSQYASIVENMTVSEAKKAGSFMDGCKVFLSGFSPTLGEKMCRILSLGGATVFSELCDSVSHVLVGEFIVNDMKALNQMAQKPHVVTADWITASMKQGSPAPEEAFYCMGTPRVVPEPPSPLSQKNLQLLSDDSAAAKMPPPAEPTVPRKLFSEFVKENAQSPAKKTPLAARLPQENISTNLNSTEASTIVEIFVGQKFLIAGFNEESTNMMVETIEALGGCVVAADFTGVADYAVVPSQVSIPNITAVEVVTSLWLDECMDMKEVVQIQYYHQPFPVAEDKLPLQGCCISLSHYTGNEKTFLAELVQTLGATYQDVFARVAKLEKNVAASTHLVCPVAEGQKYKAAVKWGLPVVDKDWLITCAKQGVRVSETPFLVNSALATKTPDQNPNCGVTPAVGATPASALDLNQTPVTSKANSAPEEAATPVARVTPARVTTPAASVTPARATTPASVTPDSNARVTPGPSAVTPGLARNPLKRLSSAQTPESDQSPFHVKTPDTPYGQVFGTPTNSSKKRWKKFIDEFPTKNVPVQPSPKRRRESTPLSELKRKVFQMALGQMENSGNGAELELSRQSNRSEEPNYSIEEMDEDLPTAEGQQNCENVVPRRFSGRGTPTATDFKGTSEAKEPEPVSNDTPKSSKKTPNGPKPSNEAVSALLGNLQKRLSLTPGSSMVESQLPQRQMVSPSDLPPTTSKPGSSTLRLPESQPVLIGWEDPVESAEKAKATGSPAESPEAAQKPKSRKFVLSNVAERDKYEKLLAELGETVVTSQAYDSTTTHLIMDTPVRSEKFLCCLAAGRWILHTSYVDQMVKQKNCNVPEEDYEWGSEVSAGRLPTLTNAMEKQLAAAAVRWRRELQARPGRGAFSDILALLVASPSKYESYQRLILAGGGSIVPPGSYKEASHCFVEPSKVSLLPVPLTQLAARRVPCLPPVYLGDMLIKFPCPPVEDSLIPEYRNALQRS